MSGEALSIEVMTGPNVDGPIERVTVPTIAFESTVDVGCFLLADLREQGCTDETIVRTLYATMVACGPENLAAYDEAQ